MAITAKTSLPPLPPTAAATEMTTTMMPATILGMRGRKSAKRYKRKDNFGEYGKRESGFNGDYLVPQRFIPNLPSATLLANKRQHTIPHASWE
jgi:hypothetical protein